MQGPGGWAIENADEMQRQERGTTVVGSLRLERKDWAAGKRDWVADQDFSGGDGGDVAVIDCH